MTILIDYEATKKLTFNYEEVTELVVREVLKSENCPYEVELNLLLTDNDEIWKINKEYRKIDRPTDVLSFPMLDFETPSDFSLIEKFPESYMNLETNELLLGDIIISIDKVYEQAEEFGHSIKREFAFLVAHSMLHLLGYDHIDDSERLVMEKKQSDVLNSLGITRNKKEVCYE